MGRVGTARSAPKRLVASLVGLATALVVAVVFVLVLVLGPSEAPSRPASQSSTLASTPTTGHPSKAGLRAVGSGIWSDEEAAARVHRSGFEPRPGNAAENLRMPTADELATFRRYTGQWGECEHLRAKVTGGFVGTTDEILQWAAWKWGLPEDVLRAVAVSESNWDMSYNGDGGASWGLMQIKNVERWHGGTYELSRRSTAFNVDYHAGMVRHYFEGCATWMQDHTYGGHIYGPGDFWGSIGAWFSGDWYSPESENYVAGVKRHLTDVPWERQGF
ncbi:MAG TPA: hypothetical protein VG795_00380 [Acidimicrobiia bacterium]|nr:hypothetical protein [Acidimicrobiia bacterium]